MTDPRTGQSHMALDIPIGHKTLHSPSFPLYVLDCTVLHELFTTTGGGDL